MVRAASPGGAFRGTSRRSRLSRPWLADGIGAGLGVLLIAVVVTSASITGRGQPWPAPAMVAAAAIAYLIGRLLAPIVLALAALIAGAIATVLMFTPFVWLASPLAPPLGYSNANAALYVQATALAAIAAVTTAREGLRLFALALTGGLVLLTISTDSLAGLVTGLAVVAALLSTMSGWRPRRRVLTAVLVAAVLAVQVVVLVLGATYRPPSRGQSSVQAAAASSLSERRLALWHDGISLAVEHPLVGVGPQTFPQTSPTARANPDTRETHSAPLQMAAETGWLGGAALLCLLLWAVVRPLLTEPDKGVRAEVVITAAATTGLALHASVDYVLMFPVVVITAALVLGIGTAGSDER